MTGNRAKQPAQMSNKRPAETTLERDERTLLRWGSTMAELEDHLHKVMRTAQAMGHTTISTAALGFLTQLIEYYNITTTPTIYTNEIDSINKR